MPRLSVCREPFLGRPLKLSKGSLKLRRVMASDTASKVGFKRLPVALLHPTPTPHTFDRKFGDESALKWDGLKTGKSHAVQSDAFEMQLIELPGGHVPFLFVGNFWEESPSNESL